MKTLVVGDFIFDQYLIGTASKLNPEAPGFVVSVEKRVVKPGGAGFVVAMLLKMGIDVTFFTSGLEGSILPLYRDRSRSVKFVNIDANVKNRMATSKTRIVCDDQLLGIRLDQEDTHDIEQTYEVERPIVDVVVIQDYGKGVCTNTVVRQVIDHYSDCAPVFVDPCPRKSVSLYEGCTLFKCNEAEARSFIDSGWSDIDDVMKDLVNRLPGSHVVITLGKNGMQAYDASTRQTFHIQHRAVEVRDVCGAGDTVLSVLAANPKFSLVEAAHLAAEAAAEQCTHLGCESDLNFFKKKWCEVM